MPNIIIGSKLGSVLQMNHKVDPLEWWKSNEEFLSQWSAAMKKALLMQPSSAAAERCSLFFSNLELSYLEVNIIEESEHIA